MGVTLYGRLPDGYVHDIVEENSKFFVFSYVFPVITINHRRLPMDVYLLSKSPGHGFQAADSPQTNKMKLIWSVMIMSE